jgi:hypothetical protein
MDSSAQKSPINSDRSIRSQPSAGISKKRKQPKRSSPASSAAAASSASGSDCDPDELVALDIDAKYKHALHVYRNVSEIRLTGECFTAHNCKSIIGNGNTIYGEGNVINGNGNKVYCNSSEVNGDENKVRGRFNRVHGERNRVRGMCNTVKGRNNDVKGKNSTSVDIDVVRQQRGASSAGAAASASPRSRPPPQQQPAAAAMSSISVPITSTYSNALNAMTDLLIAGASFNQQPPAQPQQRSVRVIDLGSADNGDGGDDETEGASDMELQRVLQKQAQYRKQVLTEDVAKYADVPVAEGTPEDRCCVICSEREQAPITITPCGHSYYCKECLVRWIDTCLRESAAMYEHKPCPCPHCRNAIQFLVRVRSSNSNKQEKNG